MNPNHDQRDSARLLVVQNDGPKLIIQLANQRFECTLLDESIGGMRLEAAAETPVEKGQTFELLKEDDVWTVVAMRVTRNEHGVEIGVQRIDCR